MTEYTIIKCTARDLPDNIIGAAVLVENQTITHAGIFIRYNGDSKLFHFDGTEVLLEDFTDNEIYFFNELSFINTALAASFLAHCEIVMKEAKPKFGYFYVGSIYDEEGKFRSPGDFPEYMTCVGFCLSFLKFFHDGVDLFDFEDWNTSGLDKSEEYISKFIEKVNSLHANLNVDDFKMGIRRIWPVEYFSSSYSPDLPIKKVFIDSIVTTITNELLKKARA